jgi:hypothetical protein
MRVNALSKSYFGQSTNTELIRHPSSRAPRPQPMIPPGVLPTRLAALAPGRSADAATSTTQTPGLQLRIGNGSRLRRAVLAPRPRRRQPATRHADAATRRIDELTSPAKIALTSALLVPPLGLEPRLCGFKSPSVRSSTSRNGSVRPPSSENIPSIFQPVPAISH